MDDVEDMNTFLCVEVPRSKTDTRRTFVIKGEVGEDGLNLINFYRKYIGLRPQHVPHKRLFVNYQHGKCTVQPVGVNKFAKVPFIIAKFLNLEDSDQYTGHCFRRSSATLLADTGAYILSLKRHGRWKSSTVAEGYVEQSIQNKIDIADQMFPKEDNPSENIAPNNENDRDQNENDLKTSLLKRIVIKNSPNCTFNINLNSSK